MTEQEILTRLNDIDTKLGNHIVHIAGDIAGIKTDIGWIKDSCRACKTNYSNTDKAQNVNIDWLKEIVKFIAFAIIGGAIGLFFAGLGK